MDKKKKIIFIVLVIILLVLCAIGVLSFISYSNSKPNKNNDFEEVNVDPEKGGEPMENTLLLETADEFAEYIKSTYYDESAVVKVDSDNNGCYKATGPDNVRYSYCTGALKVSIEG